MTRTDGGEIATDAFRTEMEVRWGDLDANGHVRNTAYSEFATQARLRFLDARGFPPGRFDRIVIGPIYFREETVFRRELRLGDVVTVEVRSGGLAPDASRWRVAHRLLRPAGQVAGHVTVEGAWMDLAARELALPPDDLAEALRGLPHGEGFEELDPVGG